jgi:hemolysin activation/secretion protein
LTIKKLLKIMGLGIHGRRAARPPWNYGGALAFVLALLVMMASAHAQQASSPGFDVRQTERRFEAQEYGQTPGGQRGVAVPRVARGETQADPTPLFVLRNVSLTGAHAIAPDQLAGAWRPFIGKTIAPPAST